MVVSSVITTTNLPQYVVENTEMDLTLVVTASGGSITNPAYGIGLNSGAVAQFYDGSWKTMDTVNFITGMIPGTIADGANATFTGLKLRFPSVSQNSPSAIDFAPGHIESGSFVRDGPIITKSTTVINSTEPVSPTLLYVAIAAAIGAAAIAAYAILRRKR